jgi:hypothetical protein
MYLPIFILFIIHNTGVTCDQFIKTGPDAFSIMATPEQKKHGTPKVYTTTKQEDVGRNIARIEQNLDPRTQRLPRFR